MIVWRGFICIFVFFNLNELPGINANCFTHACMETDIQDCVKFSHPQSSKLLEEKDEHIETLQERVRTLEQRVSNSTLSGDDRTAALEAERAKLEEKLSEARQQLVEVKSTWSDKITHLEHQVRLKLRNIL